ncbi:hypothetical protein ACU6RQ_08000 [Zobellella denitrificans]
MNKTNVTVAGLGYVGLANAVLLARQHAVVAYDINPDRVALLAASQSPVQDHEISDFLANQPLRLSATTCPEQASGQDHEKALWDKAFSGLKI